MDRDSNDGLKISEKLVFDLQLALYLDLVNLLEHSGVVSYRQMAARVLNLSLAARNDGDKPLAEVLEGIAGGFAGQGEGLSIGLLKAAHALRADEALGDIPASPDAP
jgi:hypothetical protein